ncbi:MAG: SEL1-like repeat protein [Gammaproteobacteria bacterium]|nr:SEL1-like repeat protein [Gammaproteobacteria bacterium]MDE2070025.1 SEL1-like repeat protein [Gammaproteobacteria bacterium]
MSTPQEWLEHGQALLAANAHDTPAFAEGLELLKKSAAAGLIEAQLALGHVHAQFHVLPDAAAECVRWYRQAAERGHPVAQDRLADLYLLGRGVPRDDAQALYWYTRTAAQAYPHALCNLAYMQDEGLGADSDARAAAENYLRAVALADARGLFNLGQRCALAADTSLWPAAHACLSLAAFAQYPLAAEESVQLDVRLSAADRERGTALAEQLRLRLRAFQQRFEADRKLAGHPPALLQFALENLATLGEPAFTLAGTAKIADVGPHRTQASQAINAAPRIFTVDQFVSAGECAHLMAQAQARFAPAREATRERLSGEQTAFSGDTAVFYIPDCDAVVRNIERRIAAAFNLPATRVEPLSVLRYRLQDSYAPHTDYFDAARLENNRRHGDNSGQRIASFLVYLRAPEQGGETHYLKLNRKIAGRARMALCHFNLTSAGTPDEMTLHTGAPVLKGEKWLARTTLRENPFF